MKAIITERYNKTDADFKTTAISLINRFRGQAILSQKELNLNDENETPSNLKVGDEFLLEDTNKNFFVARVQ